MTASENARRPDYVADLTENLVQLARLAVAGDRRDILTYLQRCAHRYRNTDRDLSRQLGDIAREAPTRSAVLRRGSVPEQLSGPGSARTEQLLRTEYPTPESIEMVLPESILAELNGLVRERAHSDRLLAAGLAPARTALFVGPPGVGKTMAARWLAAHLGVPLMIVDLASIMGSLLGQTGSNFQAVMSQAAQTDCVLLLDELDALAKSRSDQQDVGELKRLVTVVLQQIDTWSTNTGLLVGATNHPELIDSAAWRRFDTILNFPLPDFDARVIAINLFARTDLDPSLVDGLARCFAELSFSDIEREILKARRASLLAETSLETSLLDRAKAQMGTLDSKARRSVALDLVRSGASQRSASELTGVSRDTIRKADRSSSGRGGVDGR